ncbi:MAG: M23 family metallopeptidase [bacterium]
MSSDNNQNDNRANKKDKNAGDKTNTLFEKGGFSIVVCTSIAILVVASLYFSNNSGSSGSNNNMNELDNLSVNSSDIKSYKENLVDNSTTYFQQAQLENNNLNNFNEVIQQVEIELDLLEEENLLVLKEEDKDKEEDKKDVEEDKEDSSKESITSTEITTAKKEDEEDKDKEDEDEDKEEDKEEDKKDDNSITESTSSQVQVSNSVNFSLFDDSKEMAWPVEGQIVMNYSMDTAIYDKTLDLYRTNDSICISVPEGTNVLSSADGVVENIFLDNVKGNSVVINHGNGWVSTYSQLTDNLNVSVGQVVDKGEQIGNVSLPSNYSVLLGPHLDFTVRKDDLSSDPLLVLAQVE